MDGCKRHGVISTTALAEWDRVEGLVKGALAGLVGKEREAEFNAQASAIVVCHCCLAPALDWQTVLCPTCAAPGGCGRDYCKAVSC